MLTNIKRHFARPRIEYTVICSMLQLSSGTMVRSLKSGNFIPPWRSKNNRTSIHPTQGLDVVHINGGLDEVWTPPNSEDPTSSLLHVLVSFVVSFTLSEPLKVESIRAEFEGGMNVDYTEPTSFLELRWTLWDQGELAAGKKYEFEVVAEIPSTAPCSLETTLGNIDYTFFVRFEGILDCGQMCSITKSVKIWNPYLVFDVPRPGLRCSEVMESELVGTMINVGKDLTAFIRYPDQCLNGSILFETFNITRS
jgi:hypothetical protein